VRSRADISQLNLPHAANITEKWEKDKVKTDKLRSIGKQSAESVESVPKESFGSSMACSRKLKNTDGFGENVDTDKWETMSHTDTITVLLRGSKIPAAGKQRRRQSAGTVDCTQ